MSQQRNSDTPPTIERSTDLDMDVDELWQLISTAEGWREWLVDEADIDVSAGSEGSTSDAGRTPISSDRGARRPDPHAGFCPTAGFGA